MILLIDVCLILRITIHILNFVIFDFAEDSKRHTKGKDRENNTNEVVTAVKESDDSPSIYDDNISPPTVNDGTFKGITLVVSISVALLILTTVVSLIRAAKLNH